MQTWRNAYCLFCRTGSEASLARSIGEASPQIKVIAPIQEKHKIENKNRQIDRKVFLPGYLFLYTANDEIDCTSLRGNDDAFKLLGDERAERLHGSDLEFAKWLWINNGLVGVSRIRREGDKVIILSGPMKYFAKSIIKIDYHTRNALVKMHFLDRITEMWLAFEFEEEI